MKKNNKVGLKDIRDSLPPEVNYIIYNTFLSPKWKRFLVTFCYNVLSY